MGALATTGLGGIVSRWFPQQHANRAAHLDPKKKVNPALPMPLVHCKMNDDAATTVVVNDGSGSDGTLNGGDNTDDWATTGKINGGLHFTGDRYDNISVGDHSFGDASSDDPFTLAAWINVDDLSAHRPIICKSDDPTIAEYQLAVRDDTDLTFACYDGSTSNQIRAYSAIGTITTGTWIHVAATYDGSGSENGITLYINGADATDSRSSQGSYTAMHDTAVATRIGAAYQDNVTYHGEFDGIIDDVRIYDSELTAGQIADLYNGGDGTETTRPESNDGESDIADGGSVWQWIDIAEAVEWTQDTPSKWPTWVEEAMNGNPALRFSGSNSLEAASDVVGTGAVTIFLPVTTPAAIGDEYLLDNGEFFIPTLAANSNIAVTSDGGDTSAISANSSLSASTTHIICITRAADGTCNIYIDNALSGDANQDSGTPAAGTGDLTLGDQTGGTGNGWTKDIAEPVVFSRVLHATEREYITRQLAAEYGVTL